MKKWNSIALLYYAKHGRKTRQDTTVSTSDTTVSETDTTGHES